MSGIGHLVRSTVAGSPAPELLSGSGATMRIAASDARRMARFISLPIIACVPNSDRS
jgi:hypothetical protein